MTKVHFLHIGKTGGTALRAALDGTETNVIKHDHKTRLCHIPNGEKVFFFIREPCSRFVSGFNSRRRRGLPRHYTPWSEGERIAFKTYPTANSLAESLFTTTHERAAAAFHSIRHVRSSIYDWIISDRYLSSRCSDIVLIGLQEQLEKDLQLLKNIGVIPQSAVLPVDPVAAHRSIDNFEEPLSEKAIENLTRWYKRDVRFYNEVRSSRIQGALVPDLSRLPERGMAASVRDFTNLVRVMLKDSRNRLLRSLRSS